MGSPSASNESNDTQVSGYEAAITKQNKGTKKEINKGINITTSSNDTKISGYKPADYDPEKDDTGVKQSIKDAKKTSNRFENYNNDNNDGGSDNNNTITQVTKTAPTVAEVDQATTDTTPAETTEANRLLKIKKKGRSMTMMSGAKGVTRTSSDYSLGKKSLLGIV